LVVSRAPVKSPEKGMRDPRGRCLGIGAGWPAAASTTELRRHLAQQARHAGLAGVDAALLVARHGLAVRAAVRDGVRLRGLREERQRLLGHWSVGPVVGGRGGGLVDRGSVGGGCGGSICNGGICNGGIGGGGRRRRVGRAARGRGGCFTGAAAAVVSDAGGGRPDEWRLGRAGFVDGRGMQPTWTAQSWALGTLSF